MNLGCQKLRVAQKLLGQINRLWQLSCSWARKIRDLRSLETSSICREFHGACNMEGMRRFLFPYLLLLLCLASACGGGSQTNTTAKGEHVVDLSWKPSTSGSLAGYNVYRSPDGNNWSKINLSLVGSTIYDDSTVVNGDTYFYAVTAVDLEGVESVKSAIAQISIP